jgi:DNA-binding transcriptional LysR family regulator
VNLKHLETFVKIIDLKSFTKASEELYLTQPTVSKQVVDLERFFKIRLIDRTKRSVELTKAGEILYRYARELLAIEKEAIEAVTAHRGLKSGTLRIGASSIPGVYVLPQVLKRYREQFEGVELSLAISDTAQTVAGVLDSTLDLGFVGAKEDSEKVVYKSFLNDLIVLIAPAAFPGALSIEELKALPLVVREPGSGTRRCFEAVLRKKGLPAGSLKIVAELGDVEAVKEAVKGGMGYSYMSNRAIKEEVRSGQLRILQVDGLPPVKRTFYVITKKGRSMSPQVEALLKTMEAWRKDDEIQHTSANGLHTLCS